MQLERRNPCLQTCKIVADVLGLFDWAHGLGSIISGVSSCSLIPRENDIKTLLAGGNI